MAGVFVSAFRFYSKQILWSSAKLTRNFHKNDNAMRLLRCQFQTEALEYRRMYEKERHPHHLTRVPPSSDVPSIKANGLHYSAYRSHDTTSSHPYRPDVRFEECHDREDMHYCCDVPVFLLVFLLRLLSETSL